MKITLAEFVKGVVGTDEVLESSMVNDRLRAKWKIRNNTPDEFLKLESAEKLQRFVRNL